MTFTESGAVAVEVADGILTVRIERPRVLNALRVQDKRRITELFRSLDDAIRVVVLTGSGTRAFSAGSDLKEMSAMSPEDFLTMQDAESQMYESIMRCRAIVIAAVDGWALGAGCLLAAVCDLVVAGRGARFGQPEVMNGAPTPIHAAILPRIIGLGHARWLVFTGRTIDAITAEKWGLVAVVSGDGNALDAAVDLAREIASDVTQNSAALQKVIAGSWIRYPFDAAVEASMFVAASAYATGRPQSAADRMRKRVLRPTEPGVS